LLQGIIWKIDRNANHDGPGIRTSVYFKGCPLTCNWCCNPEGQSDRPVLIFQTAKCNSCKLCLGVCSHQALTLSTGPKIQVNQGLCDACGRCADVCPTAALQIWGKNYSVAELGSILDRYRMIYRKSGGGLTCTGGEPLQQGDFLLQLLAECQHQGIHTAVETSGYADGNLFVEVLHSIDWLFIDLKHMNPAKHLELTGRDNEIILRNVEQASAILYERKKALVLRQVVVPDINNGQNIQALADFAAGLPFISGVELLAYHDYGIFKYSLLERSYSLNNARSPTAGEMQIYRNILKAKNLPVLGCQRRD
jgi:pyruvate formate lyase activating enzyme